MLGVKRGDDISVVFFVVFFYVEEDMGFVNGIVLFKK